MRVHLTFNAITDEENIFFSTTCPEKFPQIAKYSQTKQSQTK